jgi:hypothetical protein
MRVVLDHYRGKKCLFWLIQLSKAGGRKRHASGRKRMNSNRPPTFYYGVYLQHLSKVTNLRTSFNIKNPFHQAPATFMFKHMVMHSDRTDCEHRRKLFLHDPSCIFAGCRFCKSLQPMGIFRAPLTSVFVSIYSRRFQRVRHRWEIASMGPYFMNTKPALSSLSLSSI